MNVGDDLRNELDEDKGTEIINGIKAMRLVIANSDDIYIELVTVSSRIITGSGTLLDERDESVLNAITSGSMSKSNLISCNNISVSSKMAILESYSDMLDGTEVPEEHVRTTKRKVGDRTIVSRRTGKRRTRRR